MIFRDDGLCYLGGAGRGENILQCLLNDVLLNEILPLVFLMASVLLLFGGAGVIMINRSAAASAALSYHGSATAAAEGLPLQKVVFFRLFSRGSTHSAVKDAVRLLKEFIRDNGRKQTRNGNLVVAVIADIGSVSDGAGKAGHRDWFTVLRADAAIVELVGYLLHGDIFSGFLEHKPHGLGVLFVNLHFPITGFAVSTQDVAAAEETLGNIFPLAPFDVL